MASRTFAIGDIHGGLDHLVRLLDLLPPLDELDTLVLLGDYVDRGPDSAGVVRLVREQLPGRTRAKVVALRGNHEEAWLKVASQPQGWLEFVLPDGNGCRECARSFLGPQPPDGTEESKQWLMAFFTGSFFPPEVIAWMAMLPYWYEDDHAIYVHGGLVRHAGSFRHPYETEDKSALLWARDLEFFKSYAGKPVICGHTRTSCLPQDLSRYTPEDPDDLWAGEHVAALDTGCGKEGGFLTALELPSATVYESR